MRPMQAVNDNFVDAAVGVIDSPVGALLAAATDQAVVALQFTHPDTFEVHRDTLLRRYAARIATEHPVLTLLREQLAQYFQGQRRDFDLPLDYPGTVFQQRVWRLLLEIPYGTTWSYLDMAERLGDLKLLRAVGGANGANPIAIVIPCHRVVNASGALGGYGGGSWRKQLLLDLEAGQQRLNL
jgi:O-6-methylguanine DNA methyltransferase